MLQHGLRNQNTRSLGEGETSASETKLYKEKCVGQSDRSHDIHNTAENISIKRRELEEKK